MTWFRKVLLTVMSSVLVSLTAAIASFGSTLPAASVTIHPAPVYAPIDQPGPALSESPATLDAALHCSQPPASATRDIILEVPPTVFDPQEAYSWNYEPAFASRGWPYCTVTVPDHSDGDVQIAAEYVVNAVRSLHAQSGRQVELIGWSQGASTSPRWALRWWPDIRPMVASLVGIAPDNEGGGNVAAPVCGLECVPAVWQEVKRINGDPPRFITAMNSLRQTFPGIAYTDIYSYTDELAGLNIITTPVSPLPAAANVLNVAEQQICPLQPFEHLTILASSAVYAVAMAALAAPGSLPHLAAIDTNAVCSDPLMPFVTPAELVSNETSLIAVVPGRLTTGMVTSEPPLKCYVTDSCLR
jgi:hypothetical protein